MMTVTPEHLGNGATQATVDQFKRACDTAIIVHQGIWNWNNETGELENEEQIMDYVWNDGQFDVRIRELLNEEVVF